MAEDDPWATATFEGNRREQLQRWAKIPFAEKIAGLEEMQRISQAFQKARMTRRLVVPPSEPSKE
jgi:hypothetical protein